MRTYRNLLNLLPGIYTLILGSSIFFFQSCRQDDPEPVNEEELITTLQVTLTPSAGGSPVTLKFFDGDGEHGSMAPLMTVSGPLTAGTGYSATIQLLNETLTPPEDVSAEVEEEGSDHLICFDTSANITVTYEDTDAGGLPLGLTTSWLTGAAGPGEVTITLRHQAGTKTGACPGAGDTDVEVTFNVSVE